MPRLAEERVLNANTVEWLLARAEELLPADGFRLVSQVVNDVVDRRSATLFTLGLVTARWSASRATNVLRAALNSAHDVEEGRSWVNRRLLALAFTRGARCYCSPRRWAPGNEQVARTPRTRATCWWPGPK